MRDEQSRNQRDPHARYHRCIRLVPKGKPMPFTHDLLFRRTCSIDDETDCSGCIRESFRERARDSVAMAVSVQAL
jgi:hypothetical protein